mgnify:CR=1 FL=1
MLMSVAGKLIPFQPRILWQPDITRLSRRIGLRTIGSIGGRVLVCPCDRVDGFETGAKADFWTELVGALYDVVSSPVHCGSYAALSSNSDATWYYSLTPSLVKWFKLYFRIVPNPDSPPTGVSSGGKLLAVCLGPKEVHLYVVTGGAVSPRFQIQTAAGPTVNGITPLQVNTWYCVELRVEGNTSGGVQKLYLDGVLEITVNYDTDGYDFSELDLGCVQWTFGMDCRTAIDCYCQTDDDTQPGCNDAAHPECYR